MGRIATLVIGGLLGAGVMAVTAKKTGSETRGEIKGLITDMKETASRANAEGGAGAVANEFINKGKEAASDAVANGQATVASATAKIQDAAADMTDSTDADDLKRKIDEARARIVDRMASNAAGNTSAAAAAGAQEAVIESVEDVSAGSAAGSGAAGAATTATSDAATSTAAPTMDPMNGSNAHAAGPGAGSAPTV